MTPQDRIQSAKSVPIGDVLAAIAGDPTRSGQHTYYHCPYHTDDTPSMHVISGSNRCYCFSCGKSADTIELVQEYYNKTFPEAIDYLVGTSFPKATPVASTTPASAPDTHAKYLQYGFVEKAVRDFQASSLGKEYLAGRGIGEAITAKMEVGLHTTHSGLMSIPRIAIPYISPLPDGKIVRAITRRRITNAIPDDIYAKALEEILRERRIAMHEIPNMESRIAKLISQKVLGPKYLRWGSGKEMYNVSTFYELEDGKYVMRDNKPVRRVMLHVLIVESELDAMLLTQAGYNAIAWKASDQDTKASIFAHHYVGTVLIIKDNDEAGEKYAMTAWEAINAYGKRATIIRPTEGKDVTEWWIASQASVVEKLEMNGVWI